MQARMGAVWVISGQNTQMDPHIEKLYDLTPVNDRISKEYV